MAYMIIFTTEMVVTGGTAFAYTTSNVTNISQNSSVFTEVEYQEATSGISGAWATMTHIARILVVFGQAIFLWCPTLWSGYLLWVYWFICFPVAVGFVLSLAFIIRGVHSA